MRIADPMHDDVLASLDRYLGELRLIREGLVSARPVRPGERRMALVRAVHTSERFQREASQLLGGASPGGCPDGLAEHPDRVGLGADQAEESPAALG